MTAVPTTGFNKLSVEIPALLGLFIAAYWVPIRGMVHVWQTNEDYSYAYLIPLVSLYLLWERRVLLRSCPLKSCWSCFPFLVVMVLVSLYGILGSSGNIAMPAIPILIILLSAFCFGIPLTKRAFFPLGFLIFMIPVPAVLERTLGMYLKSVSSQLGGAFIRLCGFPVYVSGNLIDLGVTKLEVVDACNGLRYLFPLFAIGIIYAYFFERVTWKRLFCVIATIPIAILINSLRIGITGILANYYGKSAAEGFFHDFTGWIMFMVAFALLHLGGRLLALYAPEKNGMVTVSAAETCVESGSICKKGPSNAAFFTAMTLLVIVGLLSWSTGALPPLKLRSGIASFPMVISDWHGISEPVDPETIEKSGAEEAFSALYKNNRNEVISLYMGYRSTAFLENENFFHSPTVCLPSNGMKTTLLKTKTISSDPVWGNLTVTEMVTEGLDRRLLVYFWFHTKNRVTHDKNINRFHLTMHALTRDNTYDLFLRPITYLQPHETIADGERRLDQFTRALSGATQKFIAAEGSK